MQLTRQAASFFFLNLYRRFGEDLKRRALVVRNTLEQAGVRD